MTSKKRFFSISMIILIQSCLFSIIISDNLELNGELDKQYEGLMIPPIIINDNSANNWAWARNNNLCSGSGTQDDPYIIQDLLINANDLDSGIIIENSVANIEIRNCKIINCKEDEYAVYLINTSNIILENIDCFTTQKDPTNSPRTSSDNVYWGNVASGGAYGFFFQDCHNNTVIYCTLYQCSKVGILLNGNCYENNITLNNISESNIAIFLNVSGYNNSITYNNMTYNNYGIKFDGNCDNNSIIGNRFENNYKNGINITTSSSNNTIFNNVFKNNTLNAKDDGFNNHWDNGSMGNCWDDYTGLDSDGNGIGDTPYNLVGNAGSTDNYPIMGCSINIPEGEDNPLISYGLFFLITMFFSIFSLVIIINRKRIKR